MTRPSTYRPSARHANGSSPDLFDPNALETGVADRAAPRSRPDIRILRNLVRNLASAIGEPLVIGLITISALVAADATTDLSALHADDILRHGKYSAAFGFGLGAGLFWKAQGRTQPGNYSRIHFAVLVASLASLSEITNPAMAFAITLPFLVGYGAASFLILLALGLSPALRRRAGIRGS